MKKTVFYVLFFTFFFNIEGNSAEKNPNINNYEDIFNVGQMLSHDKKFTLFFRTREKAVLAKGEGFNYIADYPQDLYILFNNSSKIKPLITYDWFPKTVKKLNPNLNLPVFPEDYAYYLLKDNKTLIMTKLDGTAKGGILIALAKKFQIPIIAVGVGEKEDDLLFFNAKTFVDALLSD